MHRMTAPVCRPAGPRADRGRGRARRSRSGRIASLLGAEGGHSIGCSLGTLRLLHVLGVRYLTLTHNDNVAVGRLGHRRAGAPAGSRAFGVEVVREMNRLGMLVDLSHVSADTMRDALRVSEAPVIFSPLLRPRGVRHARATCPTTCWRRCATNGGVCMVTFVPEFVSPAAARWRTEAAAAAARGRRRARPTTWPSRRSPPRGHATAPEAQARRIDAGRRARRARARGRRRRPRRHRRRLRRHRRPAASGWRTSAATPGCSPRSPTAAGPTPTSPSWPAATCCG